MRIIFFLLFQFITVLSIAQDPFNSNYFAPPLTVPLALSGSFCEIRTNHFHAGIDLRTYGKEGFPVLASADGFVSRIKVSSTGYGKALYLTHPNGKVTVYGHLRKFADTIQRYVEESQHSLQAFEIELFPDSNQFVFQKPQQIGLSGNSGGSEAPHLHFEIRERYSEEPLNPLVYGIQVKDTFFPVITHVALYRNDSLGFMRIFLDKVNALNDSVYVVKDTIKISDSINKIGLSFSSYDKSFVTDSNDVGIYSATLINENDTLFHYEYNRLNFDETRYVNAHIDYEARINKKLKLERCFSLPGDYSSIFKIAGNGVIDLSNNHIVNPRLIIKDFAGLSSTLLLEIAKDSTMALKDSGVTELRSFNTDHTLKSTNSIVKIPVGALYSDLPSEKIVELKQPGFKSPVIKVFDKTIPLHKSVELGIRMKKVPASIRNKLLIASINNQNKITGSAGGSYKNGWITTKILSFGNYVVTVDTQAPIINQFEIITDSVCLCPVLSVKITDDLTGIQNFIGCIGNEWALMEYDRKTDRLLYFLKTDVIGPQQLTIQASDKKGNNSYFEWCF